MNVARRVRARRPDHRRGRQSAGRDRRSGDHRRRRAGRRAGLDRPARPFARTGAVGEGNHRNRRAGGGGGRVHDGGVHAQHQPGGGQPGDDHLDQRARPAKACVNVFPTGRDHQGPRGRGTGGHRRDGAGGRRGDHRRRPLRAEPRPDAPRGRIRADVRPARARPLPGLQPRGRRRDARRLLEHGARPARVAGGGRGIDRLAQRRAGRVVRLGDPLPASELRGQRAARARSARTRRADHGRGLPAPPRADRRGGLRLRYATTR